MKTREADVIVVALGPAGLAAAIAAVENGASVIAFEKSSTTGGAAKMGMGPFAVESRLQQQHMIGLSKEEVFRRFMESTHWKVNARLVRDFIWKSADTIDWLMEMGVQFFAPMKYFPQSEPTWHVVAPQGGGLPGPGAAASMTKAMTKRAQDLGVEMYLASPVSKLIIEDGRICGVIARDKNGEAIQANGKAVIIATGGCGDNPEMLYQELGLSWGKDFFGMRVPGVTGDGLKMAWEAGAGKSEITVEKIFTLPFAKDLRTMPLQVVFNQPNLLVNLLGERLMDEGMMEHIANTANVIARQQGSCAFSIISDSIIHDYKKRGVDVPSNVFPGNPFENWDDLMQKAVAQGMFVFEADSLEELAVKTGIDPAGLAATVTEYNKCCEQNYDDFFDKKRKYLKPIKGNKYYAGKFYTSAYGSLGGIKINYKTEVLTDDFQVIPGLYAAGTDVCDIYAGTYVFEFPGNTMGFALNSGRIAGENAANFVALP
jgi:fumarate reductase flavoprotein subunit